MSEESHHSKDVHGNAITPFRTERTERDEKGTFLGSVPAPPPPRDVSIGLVPFCLISFVRLVLMAVSVGTPWHRKQHYSPNGLHGEGHLFYLFEHVTKVEGSLGVVTHPRSLCTYAQRRARVMEAFSIRSVARNMGIRNVTLVFTARSMGSLRIEVCFNLNVYLCSLADSTSRTRAFASPWAAWLLTALDSGIIAASKFTVPLDAQTVDKNIHSFMLPHIALVLQGWNVAARGGHTSLFVMSFQPSLLVQYFRADEAFGISPILLNMLTGGFSLVASSFGTMVSCFAITAASPPDEEMAKQIAVEEYQRGCERKWDAEEKVQYAEKSAEDKQAILFTLARTFPQFKMEKLVRASMNYTIFGLASGVYWRELTKHLKYVSNGTSQLRVMHTHCFALGSFFFLFVLLLEKCFALTKQKNYKKFYITYNIGLGITLMIMMIHGTLTVMGNDQNSRLISWTAGLGHIFLSVGFGYFYNVLLSAVRASGDKAGKKTVTASP
ncbi:hypothetical protein CGC20_30230 [Leishmania donovani]|uniref:Uncharacterized protein n=2 Tax=Leishmania donovani TaxID=5661 RepID=A0A504Y4F2_LEIDO|nr:hypothetical protein CGC20_30230 [Leishmania donovani]